MGCRSVGQRPRWRSFRYPGCARRPAYPEGEHGDPMFFTSSYVFRTAADAAARFAGEVPGNVYSRYTLTVHWFEERIAALEVRRAGRGDCHRHGGHPGRGDEPVQRRRPCAGIAQRVRSTISLFEKYFKRSVLKSITCPGSSYIGWEGRPSRPIPKLFVESPSNPLAELVDIAALSEVAHAKGAMLVVDNYFYTRPCSNR